MSCSNQLPPLNFSGCREIYQNHRTALVPANALHKRLPRKIKKLKIKTFQTVEAMGVERDILNKFIYNEKIRFITSFRDGRSHHFKRVGSPHLCP